MVADSQKYRINGFDQIKAFYGWVFANQEKSIRPTHISLYMFLINQNNRSNWVEWFKLPFDLGMKGSGISSKETYYKCLTELTEWNMISYQKGKNMYQSPLIKIEVLKPTATVPLCEPLSVPLTEPLSEPQPLPLLYRYGVIDINSKPITGNLKKEKNKNGTPVKNEFLDIQFSGRKSLIMYGHDADLSKQVFGESALKILNGEFSQIETGGENIIKIDNTIVKLKTSPTYLKEWCDEKQIPDRSAILFILYADLFGGDDYSYSERGDNGFFENLHNNFNNHIKEFI